MMSMWQALDNHSTSNSHWSETVRSGNLSGNPWRACEQLVEAYPYSTITTLKLFQSGDFREKHVAKHVQRF